MTARQLHRHPTTTFTAGRDFNADTGATGRYRHEYLIFSISYLVWTVHIFASQTQVASLGEVDYVRLAQNVSFSDAKPMPQRCWTCEQTLSRIVRCSASCDLDVNLPVGWCGRRDLNPHGVSPKGF